jgi:hypothetical protein
MFVGEGCSEGGFFAQKDKEKVTEEWKMETYTSRLIAV